MVQEIFW